MAASYAINYTLMDVLEKNECEQPELLAVLITSALGLAKEAYDYSRGGQFSYSDLTANAIGITSSTLIHFHLRY